MRLSYNYRRSGLFRQGAARAVLGLLLASGRHPCPPTPATAWARLSGSGPSSTGWSMIASSRVKPGASNTAPSRRRFPSGAGPKPRPSGIFPPSCPTGRRPRATYHVIPVYRNRHRFPFGHISAPFELKTHGTIRAKSPRLPALGGRGRFRKVGTDFPFGQRIPSPVPASGADWLPPVNTAVLPLLDDASDPAMFRVGRAPVGVDAPGRVLTVDAPGFEARGWSPARRAPSAAMYPTISARVPLTWRLVPAAKIRYSRQASPAGPPLLAVPNHLYGDPARAGLYVIPVYRD